MDNGDIQWLTFYAPAELIANSYHVLMTALEADLLDRLRTMPPAFFEAVIVDVLLRLGYGGGQPHMGQAIGRSGDGGIDGVIREDALGLDIIYLQAKRYGEGRTVGRPEVQNFAGSLDGVGATKGILITTGGFSAAARKYVTHIPKRIVLIAGNQLVRLMVEHGVGVRIAQVYKIGAIDETYFGDARPAMLEFSALRERGCAPGPGAPASVAGGEPTVPARKRSRRPASPRVAPSWQAAVHR